jgi:hypothetical protein
MLTTIVAIRIPARTRRTKTTIEARFVAPVVNVMERALRTWLQRWFADCMKKFPGGMFEGVVAFDGVEHFVTCEHRDGIALAYITPRDLAEELLNAQGLSTIEPWSPWPGRTRH